MLLGMLLNIKDELVCSLPGDSSCVPMVRQAHHKPLLHYMVSFSVFGYKVLTDETLEP
jgi:hypothetical protein